MSTDERVFGCSSVAEHGEWLPGLDGEACPDCGSQGVESCGELLSDVEAFLGRFVVYPSEAARLAHVLWIAHTWLMDEWDSTPRIAFLSPEPASGKSRALEVTELLVPDAVHAVNTTPNYLIRRVSDDRGRPTILYDEIDTVFGPLARGNEEVRAILNAGHRKGAIAGRCKVVGKVVETEELAAYCAVALAGLDDLPDTIMTRSVVVRMRRRAPGERVEPWRVRVSGGEARLLGQRLAEWSSKVDSIATWPTMPEGVEDRDADVWEALLAVADLAGPEWASRARVAAVALVTASRDRGGSLGIRLLRDLRTVFGAADRLSTETIIERLLRLEESPWTDLNGKPLDARGLAARLRKYGEGDESIRPKAFRDGSSTVRGYEVTAFADAWNRYLPITEQPETTATTATTATASDPPGCQTCDRPLDRAAELGGAATCTDCEAAALLREHLGVERIPESREA